jgi:opacity protein-like surface antigen
MKTEWRLIGSMAVAALALATLPAAAGAQPEARADHEISVYAGRVLGDDLTETEVSGRMPQLDDDVLFGVRYGYRITDSWGIEFSVGQSNNAVTDVPGGDIDLDLTTFDADAVWHFGRGARWAPYLVFGVGYATTDLDRPIAGDVGGRAVEINDDSGYTLNAGVGAKYSATDRVTINLEARYRYLDALVDTVEDSLGTVEPTVAVGWKF